VACWAAPSFWRENSVDCSRRWLPAFQSNMLPSSLTLNLFTSNIGKHLTGYIVSVMSQDHVIWIYTAMRISYLMLMMYSWILLFRTLYLPEAYVVFGLGWTWSASKGILHKRNHGIIFERAVNFFISLCFLFLTCRSKGVGLRVS
jgi:hypothetical protein